MFMHEESQDDARSSREPAGTVGRGRVDAVDVARGLAICGMVAFHADWDFAYWGWRDTGPTSSPAWVIFGHLVAGTFLFISGYCLVLAHHHGLRAALRRIGWLSATAMLITAVTLWLFPSEAIVFGIIHCIAASNLIGLAFVAAPPWVALGVGSAAAMAPRALAPLHLGGPEWLGLSPAVAETLDFRPLLPWLSVVLFGIAAARLGSVPRTRAWPRWVAGLMWAGRRSLPIYLIHQPIFFGLFSLLAALHPNTLADETAAFGRQCRTQCMAVGAGAAGCTAACACVERRLTPRLGPDAGAQRLTGSDLERASELCLEHGPSAN